MKIIKFFKKGIVFLFHFPYFYATFAFNFLPCCDASLHGYCAILWVMRMDIYALFLASRADDFGLLFLSKILALSYCASSSLLLFFSMTFFMNVLYILSWFFFVPIDINMIFLIFFKKERFFPSTSLLLKWLQWLGPRRQAKARSQ